MQRLSSVCGPGQIPDDKRTIGAPPLHQESPDATPSAAFRSITLNRQSIPTGAALGALPRDEVEEARTRQLIDVTIDSLAEVGFVGSTLAQIASRAGVSPGLVAHYFGDKDGLLEATFRTLSRSLMRRESVRKVASNRPSLSPK